MDTGVRDFIFPSKIGAGSRALEHLPFDLGGFGAQRPMVVCAEALDSKGGLKPLESAFKGSGLTYGVYAVEDMPTLETVREVWGHYNEGGFDAVIAVGGGAVTDVGKCLAVAAQGGPEALRELLAGGGTASATAPFAWVPTLELTGREAAPEAALGNQVIRGTSLCPNLIAVDPRMLQGQAGAGLVEAGLGALAAALCLYEPVEANPLALPYARLTARQVVAGLMPLLTRAEAPRGRLSRLFGTGGPREEEVAFVTAMAVSGGLLPEARKSLTFVLADVLSPAAGVSREVLAAVLLPTVLEYISRVRGQDLSGLLSALADLDLLCATPVNQRAEAALAMVRETINRLWIFSEARLPRSLAEAGLEKETLQGLCEQAAAMAEGWQRQEVESLLLSAWDGTRPDPNNQPIRATQEVS
ncbi:iron-containing alcohol dehydrogenase [Desulfoluna butyratoxydans]|uniref:Alcohol dehydrogenase iron-type n=1 Tax=Desulfoluna butyratoxydans TaxID=231438 RepID=A0A4U8YSJ5_9BACT|nr:iron-containing alcohol dehydrogenase [Desulfoluna butyratoxydans]VFQ47346.1 alcohol dehydrogenase iron-type [Desulfoluna butyratoxydans]